MSNLQPKIAIGDQLLNALLALPGPTMKKAKETILKFKANPRSPGLNYENIRGSDSRLHSIRIDRDYRGIVLKQPSEGAYILLWIDKHDDAYAWARRHKFSVNQQTGSIQIIDTEEAKQPIQKPEPVAQTIEDKRPDIFMPFTDKDLRRLGATDELLPLIRAVKEVDDIEKLERRLPSELYDGLYMLALGEPFDAVLRELGLEEEQQFDPEDFGAALELATNQQHFLSITDDAELEAILNEPLAKWRVFLHPSQRRLVNNSFNGPVRVLGGAGTGKTVVAMHRAKRLASLCERGDRVFFTTFTKSLITDIKSNLRKICSFDEIQRIDVENLDKWCLHFLRENGYDRKVCFEFKGQLESLWARAMEVLPTGEFTSEFLYDEWKWIVQYHDVPDLNTYIYGHRVVLTQLGVNIRGRGKKLKLNYRTPEQTRRWASRVLNGTETSDLDGGQDNLKGYRSLLRGPEPEIKETKDSGEELRVIRTWLKKLRSDRIGKVIAIAVATNKQRDTYAKALINEGLPIHQITEDQPDIDDPTPIRLVTMHRIKGLEFDDVCLAGCSKTNWPDDTAERRCLVHVASTRTKNSLLITSAGPLSQLFDSST